MQRKGLLLTLFCFLPLCSFARADSVQLANGDRLTGEMKSLVGGKLTLSTEFAGDIQIDWSKVTSLSTSAEYLVKFSDGTDAIGAIEATGPDTFRILAEPPLEISRSNVKAIEKKPSLEDPSLLENWHGNVDFGYTLTRGNTDLNNLGFTAVPVRETRKDIIRVRFQTLYSTQDGQQTSNLYRGGGRYEYFLGEEAFVFGLAEFERDDQEQLDLRTREGGGLGLKLRPGEATEISVFGGVTFLQEQFEGMDRNLAAEGLGGLELKTSLFPPLVITTRSQILPILSEDRFLFEWEANLRIPLFSGFSVGIAVFDNYDSDPPQPGIEKNDIGFLSTLGLTF